MRLQKYLASQGVDSRRKCEEYIAQGLVSVNGVKVTAMGSLVDPDKDTVTVKEREIVKQKAGRVTVIMNKPRGYVCTRARGEGKTVLELLPKKYKHLVPVGRLDKKSEGLLLLSDDGELTFQVTHPRFAKEKIYHVVVSGTVNSMTLKRLGGRMVIDGHRIQPAKVTMLRDSTKPGRRVLQFILKEGRNLQIRKMCEQVHFTVHRLTRVSVSGLTLKGLAPGKWRQLSAPEIDSLKKDT